MKRFFILFSCILISGALSCSKPQAQAPAPTPAATPVVIPIDLGNAATPEESPTPEPLEYVLEDIKGTVLIRENGEAQAEPAEEEETVEQGDEIITQAGSEASLTLDENTLFHLAENSDVQVDQLKPNLSKGFISRLMLLGGQVLSEVEQLGTNHSTFEVESGGVVCGVRGTAFEVQKEGETIHTFTYHGAVEMRKGNLVQAVVAGHHSAYLFGKGAFQPPRPLRPAEQKTYQNWLVKKAVVQHKQAERLAAIRSLSNLPPEQRKRVMENLKDAKPRDRMRLMHQMLKPEAHREMGLKPAGQGSKQGRLHRERRNNLRGGKALQKNGTGHLGRNPNSQKPGVPAQNPQKRDKGQKPVNRPQAKKPQQAIHPNRPAQNKPVNKPKGPSKPNGQKKEDQKKDKKKKNKGK